MDQRSLPVLAGNRRHCARLPDGSTGIEAIVQLRAALGSPIPAFLISGGVSPGRPRRARGKSPCCSFPASCS
jgi:hypothetical protein